MAEQAVTDIKRKTADIKDTAARQAEAAGKELSDDLAMLRLQIEELTASLAGITKDKAEAGARHVAAAARDGYEKAADTAGTAYSEAERLASQRPVEAMGVAAGLGLLAGLLLARR